ncbi:TonB-dependent receptor [Arcticibacter svalbardensis MN12-7]|uniref:TonB-dependent receptor n=1 Tax=Arcticibacter svalbardensis MN12-7 TaxID=1150600 RepID=R9GZ74_9SPHI|nr:TonB-dependent receptor [Arcticibacter svalbardensis]EOR96795.1 TonB-dependent receptor [Arcticibacter svalbardensis MN12-7]
MDFKTFPKRAGRCLCLEQIEKRHKPYAKVLLILKLVVLVIFADSLKANTMENLQRVTLSEKNAPLEKIMDAIKKQTGYNFLYNSDLLKQAKPISIEVRNAKLEEVFQKNLNNELFTFELQDKAILIDPKIESKISTTESFVQITGAVTDSTREGLPGVIIREKNTKNVAVTDKDGRFSIRVNDNAAVLVFSSIGFVTQEVVVAGKEILNVVLKMNSTSLNQVVVVGYGTQRKANVTGAVSSISGNELLQSASPNISNDLVGRLPGLIAVNASGAPGYGSSYTIRGTSTLNSNTPLIVIDGIVGRDFSQLDPNEIASITVLKDASAAAVYGARAANGVFLITTKHGQIGKPVITYSGDFGFQTPTLYPKLMNAYQYASTRNTALINQGYDPANPAQAGLFYSDQQLADFNTGKIGTDWYDVTFKKNSAVSHHNLTVSGGSKTVRYFASLGFLDQDGMYDNINFKRYNFRSNVDAEINKNLTVSLLLDGRQEENNAPPFTATNIFAIVQAQSPAIPAFHPDGKPYNTQGSHPYEMIHSAGYNDGTNNVFNGTLSFTQNLPFITPGLALKGNIGISKSFIDTKTFSYPYTMYNEDASGNITGTKTVGSATSLNQTDTHNQSITSNLSFNYDHSFGPHNLKALLLYEQSQGTGFNISGTKANFLTNIKDDFFASGPTNQSLTGSAVLLDTRRSVVGRLNYDFNGKYLIEASGRYDGSYIFAPGHQWGFFPSVSAGWNIAQESFIKDNTFLSFIDYLKLRVSNGLLGNDNVGAFQYVDQYTIRTSSGPVFGGAPASSVYYGVYPNENITWERANITDIGLDGSFWKGKFGFELDYFYKRTSDILWQQDLSVPATFGRALPDVNYAIMDNKGFEIALTHQNQKGKFRYNIRAMASYSVNKIIQIDDAEGTPDYLVQTGKPYGYMVGYDAIGLFQSTEEAQSWMGGKEFGLNAHAGDIKYTDLNSDGIIDSKDQHVLSYNNGTPKMIFGLNLGANWHNFNLNVLLQGTAKSTFMISGQGRYMYRQSNNNTFSYLLDAWTPDNKDAEYPEAWIGSNPINDQNSNWWLRGRAYARLKSAELGYTFNDTWLHTKGINRMKIYLSGFNLLTISQLKIFDPEISDSAGQYYPQQRIFNVGLNLTL